MQTELLKQINQLNPWLENSEMPILDAKHYASRRLEKKLLLPEWDNLWLILTGPRQTGKTTLAKYICQQLIKTQRFFSLLYLNCDFLLIRDWLNNDPLFLPEAIKTLKLTRPILLIDEVQRLNMPGLLLKSIIDNNPKAKLMATGSSQLEIKSKVQEHLTGRHLEALVLPYSYDEIKKDFNLEENLIFGCYPQIVRTTEKQILLRQLFDNYVNKDLVEILKASNPDVMQKLLTLMAHCSGQLVNYSKLSTDCRISTTAIYNYLDIFEKTYILTSIKPFVGNKRAEIVSNPIYYFIDNGFRNQALKNFSALATRTDAGLLAEKAVFQEIYKLRAQYFLDFNIHFWRTTSGAEVDFVIHAGDHKVLPIEVKYANFTAPRITRAYRSFLQAYQPANGIIITKNFVGTEKFENSYVHFIALEDLSKLRFILQNISRL